MTVVVFAGPTLSGLDPRSVLDAVYLPPAAQGDVLRAAMDSRTRAIGIVDGYYERVPAVWHKEILWAMTRGIHVFGGASIGALRAAELSAFGMQGVGAIYRAFAAGELEDDDEVAVAHATEEFAYRATSEPMVNIRATLDAARATGVLSLQTAHAIVDAAKPLFYPDRVYPRILRDAVTRGADPAEVEAFRHFVATGRVDRKREDALEMLTAIRRCCEAGLAPKQVAFTFHYTENFCRMMAACAGGPPASASAAQIS